ncbi:MAG: hypothetical protein ACYTG6_15860 [Planctomycetota bacterium]
MVGDTRGALVIAPLHQRDDRGGVDYLGPEFLTWLWWRADVEPRLVHPDGTELFFHVDEHLEFRGERAASRRTVLRLGVPGASMEARAALRSGKLLVAARLLFARGEEEVRFTLRAEDLDASAIRLPAPEGENPRERLACSLDHLTRFWADLDLCFSTFLELRLSDAWAEELGRIRRWGARPSQDERADAVAPARSRST